MRALFVVDDMKYVKRLFSVYLQDYDVEPEFCSNEKDAILMLKENDYDAVFIDHRLASSFGHDVIKMIKERNIMLKKCYMITVSDLDSLIYYFKDELKEIVAYPEFFGVIYKGKIEESFEKIFQRKKAIKR